MECSAVGERTLLGKEVSAEVRGERGLGGVVMMGGDDGCTGWVSREC